MSDLTERVARMLAEYVEHGSADQMVKGQGDDLVPFWTRQVPFARDVIREVLAALLESYEADTLGTMEFEDYLAAAAREHGIEP